MLFNPNVCLLTHSSLPDPILTRNSYRTSSCLSVSTHLRHGSFLRHFPQSSASIQLICTETDHRMAHPYHLYSRRITYSLHFPQRGDCLMTIFRFNPPSYHSPPYTLNTILISSYSIHISSSIHHRVTTPSNSLRY